MMKPQSVEICDDYDKEIADLSYAIRCDPNNPKLYMKRGRTYRGRYHFANGTKQNLRDAIYDFERAKSIYQGLS